MVALVLRPLLRTGLLVALSGTPWWAGSAWAQEAARRHYEIPAAVSPRR